MIRPDPFEACISKWSRQPRSSPITARPITSPTRGELGKRDLLLSLGVGQRRRDELSRLSQLAGQHDGPVLAWRHQVKLVADSLPPFEGDFEKFAKLVVRDLAVRVHELEQAGQHFLDASYIPPGDPRLGGRGIHQLIPALQRSKHVLAPKLVHDLAEVVGDEPIVLGQRAGMDLGNLPAGQIPMEPVDKRLDLEEVGQRLKQVVILLVRLLGLDVDVADQDDGGERQDFLLAPAELRVLHIALHDRDEGLGIGEVGVGDLVEYDHITAADDADLAGGVVDEEAGRGRLAARKNGRVVALVAVDVRLAGFPWGQFDGVAIGLDQRHQPPQVQQLLPTAQLAQGSGRSELMRKSSHSPASNCLPLLDVLVRGRSPKSGTA